MNRISCSVINAILIIYWENLETNSFAVDHFELRRCYLWTIWKHISVKTQLGDIEHIHRFCTFCDTRPNLFIIGKTEQYVDFVLNAVSVNTNTNSAHNSWAANKIVFCSNNRTKRRRISKSRSGKFSPKSRESQSIKITKSKTETKQSIEFWL